MQVYPASVSCNPNHCDLSRRSPESIRDEVGRFRSSTIRKV